MQRLKTREAEHICVNCENCANGHNKIMCAFRMDDSYCDRIEDIDLLIDKLKNKE